MSAYPSPSNCPAHPCEERSYLLARRIIASCRTRLEWLLRIPDLEPVIQEGISALELPGQRQGIGFRAAVDALALEHKFNLVRWVFAHYRRLFPIKWVPRIASDWGVEAPGRTSTDDHLSSTQWSDFRDSLLSELSKEQRRYKQAQATVFTAHQPRVRSIVARLVFQAEMRADAEQEGCLALIAAIDRIDDSGANFDAYASQWIARAVRNHVMRERLPVYAPLNLVSRALRDPSALPQGMLEAAVGLDSPGEDGAPLSESLEDGQALPPRLLADQADFSEILLRSLDRLTDKQREVVVLRYGIAGRPPLSTQEVARRVGITHQQVSMRERRALESLGVMLGPVGAER